MVQSKQNGVNIYKVQCISRIFTGKKNQRQCCVTSTTECCFYKKISVATSSLSTVPANNGNKTVRSYCIAALYVANSNALIATCVTGNNTTYRGLHVKWPIFLFDFNQIQIFYIFFLRKCKFHRQPSRCMGWGR